MAGSEAAPPQCFPEKAKLLAAVLLLQLLFAGFHIVSRAALDTGISQLVFIVYRNIISLALLAPFAYFLEKKDRPPLTFTLIVEFFMLALIGITANQGFYLLGLSYLSPTYASAIQNSVPAVTFAMAALLRIEKADIKRSSGVAKVVGTVICIGGATVITLYKGLPLLHRTNPGNVVSSTTGGVVLNWTLGCVFIIGHCLSWSCWMVLQVPLLNKYPARLSTLALTAVFGLIQFVVIAAFVENDPQRWKLHLGVELFSIVYAGVVASGACLYLQIWCINRGGPVFTAVFQPVQTVLVAIMAALLLGDQLYTGGIIGAVFIVMGLYLVLWGKGEETSQQMKELQGDNLTSSLLNQHGSNKEIVITDDLA